MGIKQGKALLEGPHPPQLADFTGAAQERMQFMGSHRVGLN